ncbi:MAG: NUDIX hydrolase [Nocardioidaceae bacterium]
MKASEPTLAAGAVVWRKGDQGVEVVVVHRPKYDDWSFPKGKLDPGEHHLAAAVREVAEETGLRVRLGPALPVQTYTMSANGLKLVHYWTARQVGDGDVADYHPNAEIDAVTWLPVRKARRRLSYPHDDELLDAFEDAPYRSRPLVILRHAKARSRSSWHREDTARTLTEAGRRQARDLVPMLQAYDVQRVLTSDAVRCAATVRPFADESLRDIETDRRLSEEAADPVTVARGMRRLLRGKARAVVCSHRPVLPAIFDAVGVDDPRLKPGSFVVVHHRGGRAQATEEHTA